MSYNYDPELAAMLDLLPDVSLDISDPVHPAPAFPR